MPVAYQSPHTATLLFNLKRSLVTFEKNHFLFFIGVTSVFLETIDNLLALTKYLVIAIDLGVVCARLPSLPLLWLLHG